MSVEKLAAETIIPICQGHKLPVKTSVRTLRRWATTGLSDGHGRIVKLETFRHGAQLCTTLQAYHRFCKALARGRES